LHLRRAAVVLAEQVRVVDDDLAQCPTANYTSIQAAINAATAVSVVRVFITRLLKDFVPINGTSKQREQDIDVPGTRLKSAKKWRYGRATASGREIPGRKPVVFIIRN